MRRSLNAGAQRLRLPSTIHKHWNNDSMSRNSESRKRKRAISPITQLVHTLKNSYENTKKGRSIVSPKRTRLSKLIQSFQAPKLANKNSQENSQNYTFDDDNDRPLGTLEFINKVKTNLEKINIAKGPRRKTSTKLKKVKKTENNKMRYYLNEKPGIHKTKQKERKRRSRVAKTNSFSLNGSDLLSPKPAHRSQFSFFIADNDLSLVATKADLHLPRTSKRNNGFIPFSASKETGPQGIRKSSKKSTARLFDVIQKMRIKSKTGGRNQPNSRNLN